MNTRILLLIALFVASFITSTMLIMCDKIETGDISKLEETENTISTYSDPTILGLAKSEAQTEPATQPIEIVEETEPLMKTVEQETEYVEPETDHTDSKAEFAGPETEPTEPENELVNEITNGWISLGTFKLTAYCSCSKCCGKYAYSRPLDENGNPIVYTASGARAEAGVTIAVDPKVIPYGTQVQINGNTYVAQDTGGFINGNRIDVYFDNHQEALNFGIQYAEVFIWSK